MAIPEAQLDTWSKQGSVTQSKATHESIRAVLDSPYSPYAARDCISFLQGSYGNDTNIVGRESDVDIVLRSNATFFYENLQLDPNDRVRFDNDLNPASYDFPTFKTDVFRWLYSKYGDKVEYGNKALRISGDGNRRDADVVPCFQYRKYVRYNEGTSDDYIEGICFIAEDGTRIVNYPRLHSAHSTWKHQNTGTYYKPMVRILKNMRNKLVDGGALEKGLAPSYFIEGLLYNAPHELFGRSYGETFVATINWLDHANKSGFLCVNDQYHLLHPTDPVTWRAENCEKFIRATILLWNSWK